MKLSHIRDLVAVAEFGGMRRAARHLGVAQPALSRSIRDLELELGVSLFERGPTGMTLTPAGEAFARRGAAMQMELARAQDEVRQLSGGQAGQVTVGLSPAVHLTLLPRALPPFLRRYPDARLVLSEGLFPALEGQLRDGSIDFFVGPLAEERLGGEFMSEKLFDNHRVVLCRPGHPLAGATSIEELVNARWVATSVAVNSPSELGPIFERRGLPAPTVAVQTHSALSMITVAASTDLLALVPRQWLESRHLTAPLAQIRLNETLSALAICIVSRTRLPLTPLAQHLFDLFRRAGLNE